MEKRVIHSTEAVIEDPPQSQQVDIKPWYKEYNTTTVNKKGDIMAGSFEGNDFS